VQPVPLKRVFFWTLYFLGSLFLIFRVLLSLVPGGVHNFKDYLFYLTADVIPASLLLACYWLYNKIADPRYWENEGAPGGIYRAFGFLASMELAFCLLRVGLMLVYFFVRRNGFLGN
jgi:hypothetical protein